MLARIAGLIRLTHPFPSLLDGLVVGRASRSWPARGPRDAAAARRRDDRPAGRDRGAQRPRRRPGATPGAKPGKPIPSGLVSPRRPRPGRRRRGGRRSGSSVAVAVGGPCDRRPGRLSGIGSPTTSGSRARPGRGCRSRSGSRSCPSTAGTGRPGLPACVRRARPAGVAAGAGAGDRPTLGPTSSATRERRGLDRDRPRPSACAGGSGAILAAVVVAAVGSAVAAGAPWPRGALPWRGLVPSLAAVAVAGSAAGAARERAWEVEAVGVAAIAVAWLWVARRHNNRRGRRRTSRLTDQGTRHRCPEHDTDCTRHARRPPDRRSPSWR